MTHVTHTSRHIRAPRSAVYRALIDPEVISRWKVPDGMSIQVLEHDGRVGGTFRISLTYDETAGGVGKTSGRTDTYRGRYLELVPDEKVVEVDEFETRDPELAAPMTVTITLEDRDGGTDLVATHEGLPDAVPPADNELGWQLSLAKLAALLEHE